MQICKFCLLLALVAFTGRPLQAQVAERPEPHRPRLHYTPARNWMNDPNGLVYHRGVYHLFYQYYPDQPVWGPMHWGHATSPDLLHWKEQPIALYPDSLGYIFSGSAVVDSANSSGLGHKDGPPLVAVFTHHQPSLENSCDTFEYQSLAYSVDNGNTWTKYTGNPVLRNPGIRDFRDPKVFWYAPHQRWIMSLATKDCIRFYSSPDLKAWTMESEFGKGIGARGGVWECPDLFPLPLNGRQVWVLLVNLNPGGPNGGSGTQYFLGDFDGRRFVPLDEQIRWMDYGPDNYAGVTFSNTGSRRLLIGWMSNWDYATRVPTAPWRSALTVPRELFLRQSGGRIFLASRPVTELHTLEQRVTRVQHWPVKGALSLRTRVGETPLPCRIDLEQGYPKNFSLQLRNELGEQLSVGYDRLRNCYYIDRSTAGPTDFHAGFGGRYEAPRFAQAGPVKMTLVVDVSSVELFADDGLSCLTAVCFPSRPWTDIRIQSPDGIELKSLRFAPLKPVLP